MEAVPGALSTSRPRSARRPWVAFLLSLLAPGLGHLYAGFLRQLLVAVLAWWLLWGISVFLFTQPGGGLLGLALALLVLLSAVFGVPVHAAKVASSGRPLPINRWLRVGLYVLYILAFSEAVTRAGEWVRTDLVESFRVPSAAMLPTLRVGDHFIATKVPYLKQGPQGGDVVVFWIARGDTGIFPVAERPDLSRDRFIKRVIGIPGDRIEIRGAAVYVNGTELPQSKIGEISDSDGTLEVFSESHGGVAYTIALDPTVSRQHLREVVVPPEEYFVVGDNRDYSNDSRIWGTIHRRDVIGKASHLYFSQDPTADGPQWRRIGLRVE